MHRILAIGNSFSEDATYFLHDIGQRSGVENEVINLYIGGCSLERHWRNIEEDACEYQFQLNGRKTDRYVSIKEVLQERKFDVIVTHQASYDSGWEDTYEPFLGLIISYLREQSEAGIFLNQTWAYEKNSRHGNFMRYNRNQQEMFRALVQAYGNAAQRHGLPLIKSGGVIQKLRENSFFNGDFRFITRDGFHLNYLYGRYAIALLWAKELMGVDSMDNDFVPHVDFMDFEKADEQIIRYIKKIVAEIV